MNMSKVNKRSLLFAIVAVALLAMALLPAAGCGASKGVIDQAMYGQLQNGMTIDQVEGIAGQPQRSHHVGNAQSTTLYYYYGKAEGDGLVRVAFDNGKVTGISPWDSSVNPEE